MSEPRPRLKLSMDEPPGLDEIRKVLAERSLAQFIRLGWPYIDPNDYMSNWHIDAICEHLEAVTRGEVRHLLINVPPRHMKSIGTAVAWPAWTWAQSAPSEGKAAPLSGPNTRFLFASYAHTLSVRDSLKCRRLIESPWYQSQWGDRFQLTGDQNTKVRFENDKFGYRLSTSVDGALTGEGGDVVIIDDPHNATEISSETMRNIVLDWWDGAMSTRLNNPKTGAYVVIMQRLHEDDLSGHILTQNHGEWTHLCLPARYEREHPHVWVRDPRKEEGLLLWPERVGEAELSKLERSMGPYGAAGQLQQRPAPRDGGMFPGAWFERVDAVPVKASRVRRWDLAATEVGRGAADPDYTVGVLMARDEAGFIYIEDVVRMRGSAQEVERTILNTAAADAAYYGETGVKIALSQDPGQAGKSQVGYYTRKLAGYMVSSISETGSKLVRAQPFASQAEAGNVRMKKAKWNADFVQELEVFPNGKHDDQVDAASGAFHVLVGPGIKAEAFLEMARQINAGIKTPGAAPDREIEYAVGSKEWKAQQQTK
jgi:predicted phage terminase large subunit-like protein